MALRRTCLALACALVACKAAPANPPAPAAPVVTDSHVALDPSLTVASIDGLPITAAQLDEKAGADLRRVEREYIENTHAARDRALRVLVSERLLELEAKARGVEPEQLLQSEIEAKVRQPSDDELRAAYEQFVRPRFPVTFEQAYDRLKEELSDQSRRQLIDQFHGALEQKYKVHVSLPPPRLPKVEVAATGPSKGPENAPVTIVEFSDFECPFCARAAGTLDEVLAGYEGKVRLVFRHYPLPFHANAPKAAEASMCAADQGRFWQMHDRLFANYEQLTPDALTLYAREAGLDEAKFAACLGSGEKAALVQADKEAAEAAGVEATPTLFVNGRPLTGAPSPEMLRAAIDAELANVTTAAK